MYYLFAYDLQQFEYIFIKKLICMEPSLLKCICKFCKKSHWHTIMLNYSKV